MNIICTFIFVANLNFGITSDSTDSSVIKKEPFWVPAAEVLGDNLLIHGIDRYIFKFKYATSVDTHSWKHNLKSGFSWDSDNFPINFFGHPYSGTLYFND